MSGTQRQIAEALSDHIIEISQTRLSEMIASFGTLSRANKELAYATGVQSFFRTATEFEEFRAALSTPVSKTDRGQAREMGDFQTPLDLALRICTYLRDTGVSPAIIVEPTYGMGNFVLAALNTFPATKLVFGVEIQTKYEWQLKVTLLIKSLLGRRVTSEVELDRANIFTYEFPDRVLHANNLLILGNPPWVTSATLGALDSENLPTKKNIKALNGMDALTGKSNFDVSEYILLRLLDLFAHHQGTLAMLCKNATAKNIIAILPSKQYPVSNLHLIEIDAKREFGVAVDACLLRMDLGSSISARTCEVSSLEQPTEVKRVFGWVGDKLVSNVGNYEREAHLDGQSPFVWRQGIKHDLARLMELDVVDDRFVNGLGEPVEIEQDYLFPILKSSDLRNFQVGTPRKRVIVTQRHLGQDTATLEQTAPRLWRYLNQHYIDFQQRKSSIYRGKPTFSIFGIGDYSFQPYKVAIAGLYKEPVFSLVCHIEGQPVLLDDTCYFVGFDNYCDALFTASILNTPHVKRFLRSIVFTDAKRPYTKDVLMRLNMAKIIDQTSLEALRDFWTQMNYTPSIAEQEAAWELYKNKVQQTPARSPQIGLGL